MTKTLPRGAARRIACGVAMAEVRRLRGAELPKAFDGDLAETLPVGDEGLGLDSIEQLGVLGALSETFGQDDELIDREAPRTVGAWTDWLMLRAAGGDGRMTVMTSGSTGVPRACIHPVSDLLNEAVDLAERFEDRRRVIALVPPHHLYGIIWTALLPEVLGIPVVAQTVGTSLNMAPGDLVVAVPEQWLAMLRLFPRFPPDVIGISSAGPLSEAVGSALLGAGLARLVDVYGSSETGGIALRDVPASAYDLLPRWQLRLDDADDWGLVDRDGRAVELPDHVERIGERSLRPLRRRDGAVQVGGHNVWPSRVVEVLKAVEGVADAAVRLDVDGRLKAFIVPHDDRDPVEISGRIERVVAARLTPSERPKRLRFGSALPRNSMGKLEDWS